jgi:hypothetical protein
MGFSQKYANKKSSNKQDKPILSRSFGQAKAVFCTFLVATYLKRYVSEAKVRYRPSGLSKFDIVGAIKSAIGWKMPYSSLSNPRIT